MEVFEVLVIMQRQCQQSIIDRVLDLPVATQRRLPPSVNCAEDRRDPTVAVLGVVDAPVVVQRLVPGRDRGENCGTSPVAVLWQGGRCPCYSGRRGALGAVLRLWTSL